MADLTPAGLKRKMGEFESAVREVHWLTEKMVTDETLSAAHALGHI